MVLVLLAVATVAVTSASERLGVPAPLALVVVGVVASFAPLVPPVRLEPDVVLTVLLPPLLYVAAVRTSLVDFKAELWSITLLSVGLVLATTAAVGLVVMALLPVPAGAAFALGAVVAPPDAVAATSVARRVGLPRRLVTVLQGESLVNDATALVALRSALGVLAAGTLSWGEVGGDFALAVVGGLGIGVAAGFLMSEAIGRSRDATTATCLSLLAPFVAFLPAEEVHASGVLSVVVAGLVIGHRAPVRASAATRVSTRTIWRTIQFLLEHAVFLLIGLQAAEVVRGAFTGEAGAGRVLVVCLAVLLTVVVVRFAWVFGASWVTQATPLRRLAAPVGWRELAVVSWAGLRGVVTLAAVFALPPATPYREVLVLAALVVAAATLLGQGGTLPLLVRALRLPAPDLGQEALEQAEVLQRAHEAGVHRLDAVLAEEEARGGGPVADEVVVRLRERSQRRPDSVWERLLPRTGGDEPPTQAYERLRLEMIRAEREELLHLRSTGAASQESLTRAQSAIDVEESLLDQALARTREVQERAEREGDLVPARAGACTHLRAAPPGVSEVEPQVCEGCREEGLAVWTALRRCLTCGYVGCCDSSPRRHAGGHHVVTDHPVMRSAEPGEAWRWCYPDRLTG